MNNITAQEARELMNPSPIEFAYDEIRKAAKNGHGEVELSNMFWSSGYDNSNWVSACSILERSGFKVQFFSGNISEFRSGSGCATTTISWHK